METKAMRHLQLRAEWEGGRMITRKSCASIVFLSLAVLAMMLFFAATPSQAQGNVQLDLSSTSGLCGGQQCFNVAGLFTTGTQFLGTTGMDNGNNCTPTPPYTNCPDAYSSNQIGLSTSTPPTLTPTSLGIPFTFGTVNTSNCGPSAPGNPNCTLDVVNYTTAGVVITLPAAEQTIYSTMVILGTAVNGSHLGNITATYTDNSTNVFAQHLSDWCSYSGGTANGVQTESIAVGSINRINSNGALNGATCNLYAYTLPLDVTKTLQSITLQDGDNSGASFALAITLKPPSYTIDGGAPSPADVPAGSTSTATVTVNPQPGYSGTVTLSCSIAPTIVTSGSATAPTCSLNPTSVPVTTTETSAPTTTMTFTAAKAASSSSMVARHSRLFYAFWLVPGLALTGLGFGSGNSRRRKWLGFLILGMLLFAITVTPGCVNTIHLGNVGTPPGQYTISITGVDGNGLTQASNTAGTTNTVVVTVTDSSSN
jgi:hypothetical protein